MPVPSVWQTVGQFRHAVGTGVYRTRFAIPAHWAASAVRLLFGAVSYFAEVYVDGEKLAEHEGGWLPFEVALRCGPGEHELLVRATLPDDDPRRFPEWPFAEIPHGKQSWYGKTGGIWQSVWLEQRALVHLGDPRVAAELDTGRVAIGVSLSGGAAVTIDARVVAPDGDVIGFGRHVLAGNTEEIIGTVPRPLAWAPRTPRIYRVELDVLQDGRLIDRIGKTFGFRSIATRGGRLVLNGQPFYLRGALDQDYYPGTIVTPPSAAFIEDRFAKAKALGFNCVRMHIKIPDPRVYDIADRMGMLIWADLPNAERLSARAADRLEATMRGMVTRDGHHPSIIAWSIINEDWGTDLERDPDHRAWLAATYDGLKLLDQQRLVVDNSACWPNFHVRTDIDDYHWYYNMPDQCREWDALVGDFASRPDWTFSPHGDARRRGDEPLIVSEFGNWGLPDIGGVLDADGSEPWWFETGHERHGGVSLICPHGVADRFATWLLDRIFGSFDRFVEETQQHQFRALKYEIESLRSRREIAGYVVTELADAHWEANGLMDMRGNLRRFHAEFAEVNAATAILAHAVRPACRPGESVAITIKLAAGDQGFGGGWLEWSCGTVGDRIAVQTVAPCDLADVSALSIDVPRTGESRLLHITFTLRDDVGDVVARSAATVTVLHRPETAAFAGSRVWCAETALRDRFAALGYGVAAEPDDADLLVAHRLDDRLCERVRLGARLLLLATDAAAIAVRSDLSAPIARRFPGLQVVPRDWTAWRGISTPAWGWLRRDGAYAGIPGSILFDFAFERVIPHHVLVGFGPSDYAAHVHAGVLVGWVNMPAAYAGQRFLGRGCATIATFRLTEDPPGHDPLATSLLDALVRATVAR